MAGRILILSHEGDAHLKCVTKHLTDEVVLLVNPADMLDGETIDFAFKDKQLKVFYKDDELDDIKSIWVRRPTQLMSRTIPVKARHVAYVRSAAERHLNMLYFSFPDALWFSDMTAIKNADVKVVQLRLAAKLGFNVPETLFASTPARAKEFVAQHKICIAKTQSQKMPYQQITFTKLIHDADDVDFNNIKLDPFTFQQYIEPKAEWRVSVVGDQVFTAEVGGNNTDGVDSKYRDWRVSHGDNSFWANAIQPPKKFEKQCVELVRQLGLEFGALDFIIDADGNPWFLEINPNGQWAFVEEHTGQPIGAAIARKLIAGKQSA